MPKVRFTADFDFKPTPQTTIAFKAGQESLVTTPCAEAAIAKGRAVAIEEAPPAGIAQTIARKSRRKKPTNG